MHVAARHCVIILRQKSPVSVTVRRHAIVMNATFTYWFILDRKLKTLLLPYPGRDQSLTAAKSAIPIRSITLSLCLNPVVT